MEELSNHMERLVWEPSWQHLAEDPADIQEKHQALVSKSSGGSSPQSQAAQIWWVSGGEMSCFHQALPKL